MTVGVKRGTDINGARLVSNCYHIASHSIMSFCKDCFTGVRHEGTLEGKWEKLGGVDSYVATPTIDYPKDKVLLFLPDAYGPGFLNAQLLADDFARNGFKTIIPDCLNGDPVPADDLTGTFDWQAWFQNHTPAQTRPSIDKVIKALEEQGVVTFGATGYCFGARYVFHLAFENKIKVAVANHPTLLERPTDFEKYLTLSKAPLLINSCTYDQMFPAEACAEADSILGGGKFAPGYKREHFEGCTHGFTIRGDLSDPKVKAGKEGAFKAKVEWLLEKL